MSKDLMWAVGFLTMISSVTAFNVFGFTKTTILIVISMICAAFMTHIICGG